MQSQPEVEEAVKIDKTTEDKQKSLMECDQTTVNLCDISYKGKIFKPEKKTRGIYMSHPDSVQFREHIVNTVSLFEEWMSPLVTKFKVQGGWSMPKDVSDYMEQSGVPIGNYARWFLPLDNGWTMCALFSQNVIGDLVKDSTETHYTGKCTMDVEFYFLQSFLVKFYFDQ